MQLVGITGVNFGTVEKCGNLATVSCKDSSGGIAGLNNGVIRECYNLGNISVSSSSGGGIAGALGSNGFYGSYGLNLISISGYIYNCYNNASVSGINTGGVAGVCSHNGGIGYIYNAYSIVCTSISISGNTTNCFTTDSNTRLLELNSGADSVADNENTSQPWIIDENVNGGYPVLRWQDDKYMQGEQELISKNYMMTSEENEYAKVTTTSSDSSTYAGWHAFDGIFTWQNAWISLDTSESNPQILTYQFKKKSVEPYTFIIMGNSTADNGAVGEAMIEASKDGENYLPVTDKFNLPMTEKITVYPNKNIDKYSYFRLVVTKETGTYQRKKAIISEWEIYYKDSGN